MSNLPENAATEIATKRQQWGNLGELIYKKDFELQAKGQALIAKLPTDFTDIPGAESVMAEVSSGLKALKEDRMSITNPVNNKMSELMLAEKKLEEAINFAKGNLLTAKTDAANKAEAVRLKSDELKRIREAMANYIVGTDAKFKQVITDQVVFLFKEALGVPVAEADIAKWIQDKKLLSDMGDAAFTISKPNLTPKLNTPEDVQAIWNELSTTVVPAYKYKQIFYQQLDEKFGFYSISLKNAEAAIQQAEQVANTQKAEIAEEKSAQEVANKLAAIATPIAEVVETGGKVLKVVYEIDVPDTEAGAVQIMAAYIGNLALCRSHIRVTSYRKLTVLQMATSLEGVKKKDPNFNPTGINFKSKSKL